jgi:hypothetical protein
MAPESSFDEDARLESDLDAQLRALPRREIDPRVDARVLRSARAILVEGPRRGPLHFLEVIWGRVVAPVLVTATVASYLLWAVQAAGALYR